jgi:hypothetical protein
MAKEGIKDIPTDATMRSIYAKFLETGSVADLPRSGRPSTSVSDENAIKVEALLASSDDFFSVDGIAELLDISHGSAHTLLRKKLHYIPYKIQYYQKLFDEDYQSRVLACESILEKASEINGFYDRLITSDECTFHLDGFVNRHNCRIWGSEKPEPISIKEHSSPKVNVWVGLSSSTLYGPYFFECDSIKSEDYLKMLTEFLIPTLLQHHKMKNAWFQQDGAPPHWARSVRAFLNEKFPSRWIGRGGTLLWPARSPDLAPPDFFLWGHIKNEVYKRRPKILDDLKTFITEECGKITAQQLKNVMCAFEQRLKRCVESEGCTCEKQ